MSKLKYISPTAEVVEVGTRSSIADFGLPDASTDEQLGKKILITTVNDDEEYLDDEQDIPENMWVVWDK